MKVNVIQNNFNMKSVEEPYVETTIYSIGFSTCLECFSPFLIEFRVSNREKG